MTLFFKLTVCNQPFPKKRHEKRPRPKIKSDRNMPSGPRPMVHAPLHVPPVSRTGLSLKVEQPSAVNNITEGHFG